MRARADMLCREACVDVYVQSDVSIFLFLGADAAALLFSLSQRISWLMRQAHDKLRGMLAAGTTDGGGARCGAERD